MKFSDIVDLAKAGYKPSDIKELMKLQEPEEQPEENGSEGKQTEVKGSEGKKPEEVDYKSLYEAEHKKLEELQNKNSREPIDPEPLKIDEVIKSVKKSIS